MNFIRLLLIGAFATMHAADTSFSYPPYIEIPCYKNFNDLLLKNPPFSIVAINIGPKLTLKDLQELVRAQKGPGFLMFMDTRIDLMARTSDQPMATILQEIPIMGVQANIPLEQFETFVDHLFFVLAEEASPKVGPAKKGIRW